MSLLGNLLYATCDYTYENEFVRTTPYVQTAVIQRFFSNIQKGDKITIFLTADAEKKNWEDRGFSSDELKKNAQGTSKAESYGYSIDAKVENPTKTGLKKELQELLSTVKEKNDFEIKDVLNPISQIPEGKNEQELYELFQVIYNEIRDGDEIYFDITNSFRFMPMLVMTILNYAQTLKNIKLAGIYYGEYDPEKYKTDKAMPILDLSMFQHIVDLSKAAEVFVKNGIAEPIRTATEKSCNRKEVYKIKDSMEKLDNFTKCIQCSRGKFQENENNSIQTAYANFKSSRVDLSSIEDGYANIIEPLFEKIDDSVKKFDVQDSAEIGMATVEWCYEYRQIQQGFTALEETITTKACKLCGVDENDADTRKAVKSAMMSLVNRKEKQHVKVKEQKKQIELICMEKLPKELMRLSKNVSQQRNSLNHFGFDKASKNGGIPYSSFEKKLEDFMNELAQL